MRTGAPEVDYAATSRRPTWPSLPEAVRATVGRLSGAPVVAADHPVSSGFTPAFAGAVETATGRRVFAKAGAPDQPFVLAALAQEAELLARLPLGMPAPGLVGYAEVDGWCVLVLEVVPGRMPGAPWTAAEVEIVHRACLTVAELGTPSTVGGRDVAHRMTADPAILAEAARLADTTTVLKSGLPRWLDAYRGDVAALVLGADGRFAGDTLCHGDLRPDNLLVDPAGWRAVVVDWNWVGTAAAWIDWVGLLPLMAAQGVDADRLVRRSPLTRDADPDDVDAYLATVAVYMVEGVDAPPPPGCLPVLREHQRLMAHAFLEFLAHRRGWVTAR